jgi:hypothetical protein
MTATHSRPYTRWLAIGLVGLVIGCGGGDAGGDGDAHRSDSGRVSSQSATPESPIVARARAEFAKLEKKVSAKTTQFDAHVAAINAFMADFGKDDETSNNKALQLRAETLQRWDRWVVTRR